MRLALTLCLLASAAGAQSFDGTYNVSATPSQTCDAGQVNDGMVTIAGDKIGFWESKCQLTQPTPLRDMPEAMLYDMVCSGEGETWSERIMLFRPTDGGLAILSRGRVNTYAQCE